MRISAALVPLIWPAVVAAQEPLSAIDWLSRPPQAGLPGTVLMEPPVATTGDLPRVEVRPLAELSPPLGLVSPEVTGLPVDLWRGSEDARIARLIRDVPVRGYPAMQTLLYTLILSETRAPGNGDELLLARLDRLTELGAVDAAQALVQVAGPTDSHDRFRRWFDATLLTGDEDRSCPALVAQPHLSPGYGARIFCTARRGDWQTAALTLEIAHALEILPPGRLALLDRFLSPEIFDGAPPLSPPEKPGPLDFRLFEAIGERLPTARLPLAFANADLQDLAGWKAQIEAAERLTRSGALTPNRLLGLYTERMPAASGGVWERVRAVQDLEAALQDTDSAALDVSLPVAWQAMQDAGLEVAFAELFSEALARAPLVSPATRHMSWRIRLLSSGYDTVEAPSGGDRELLFLAALAQGGPRHVAAPDPVAQAIARGFSPTPSPPPEIAGMIGQGRLGEAILEAMQLFADGARGNHRALSESLATLRAVGLEDTARRAAVQLLLLERR